MLLARVARQLCSKSQVFSSSLRKASTENIPAHFSKFTDKLSFIRPEERELIAAYRVLEKNGEAVSPEAEPQLDKDLVMNMYHKMVLLNTTDRIMYESQRQGRISFYMTSYGEEASVIGSSSAFDPKDMIYGQYREIGALLMRGFSVEKFMDSCYSNIDDANKGRQMPMHFGSLELNVVTVSSPLGTQLPTATGSAYSLKLQNSKQIVAVYFGDGSASEGDAFVSMNFAATLDCPVLFFCRNNGYAISTPVSEQYRGDGIAARGPGFGIPTVRVDGNDVFAVYNATKAARQLCLTESRPVLVEAMTYRVGHHSTSDDSSKYRSVDEVNSWDKGDNPILRLRNYLLRKQWISEAEDKKLRASLRKEVLQAFAHSEAKKKPNPLLMFTDVYDKMPPRLRKQMTDTKVLIEQHPKEYSLDLFEPADASQLE
ncbi:unnamed protein product [Calicophoron daubneyi]|uniref:2-oxoisovalerate dehydrogenase subunit alpha n=1 Tax=Calicophoron daubneyi TaxID=300641 RepID=A0AAV2TTI3_CALDB